MYIPPSTWGYSNSSQIGKEGGRERERETERKRERHKIERTHHISATTHLRLCNS